MTYISTSSPMSLFLRNLAFTILQPGVVAGLVPYWIVKNQPILSREISLIRGVGVLVFVLGLMIMIACIVRFGVEGRGTLSPVDPTQRLVVGGLYKFSRNPMYVGVMMILIGESIIFQSKNLWIYSGVVLVIFHVFILVHEEPRLRKDFGEAYTQYCKKVRRWI